jgi:phosphohistidine swiveling domain-containing protein
VSWLVDDQPSGLYPLYTRGNIGEVFPAVVSPLTWSLYGPGAEQGWRDAFSRFGAFRPDEYGPTARKTVLGVFGGYGYLNMSLIRIFAVRTPGLSVEEMDRVFFGEAEAPAYVAGPSDKDRRASLRIGRTLLGTLRARSLPQLDDDRAWIGGWEAGLAPLDSPDDVLVRAVRDFRPVFQRLFDHHIHVTFAATVGPGLLQQICTDRLKQPELMLTLLGGIGDVESAEPSTRLWELGRQVAGDPDLTEAFDAGLDGLGNRLAGTPFQARLDAFARDFGARGPNEWEGSSPTWATEPSLVLAAVDRMRLADPGHDPRVQRERLATDRVRATAQARARLRGPVRLLFDLALRSTTVYSQGRERSKTTCIQAIHAIRLRELELARRGRNAGGPDALEDFWLLRDTELEDYLADPKAWQERLAVRAGLRDRLQDLVPPFIFDRVQPDPSTWEARSQPAEALTAGAELHGIPGCPGVARGRARVVLDPIDPRGLEPGEVLVAPITDPSWTPLFVPAGAVIVDVGAQMSHAVIVARELGIPAVVSVAGATRRIPDGAMVEVDGTTGIIRLL